MEAIWKGSRDGFAVAGGTIVHNVRIQCLIEITRQGSSFSRSRLYLYCNKLTFLPDSIGLLTNLTVYGIQIVISFPFFIFVCLHRLSLHSNRMTTLPECIGCLTHLTQYGFQSDTWFLISFFSARLHLNTNELTHLPASIGQLTNLSKYDTCFVIWFQFSSFLR